MGHKAQLNGRFGRNPNDLFLNSNFRLFVPKVGDEIGHPNNFSNDKYRMEVREVAESPDGWVVKAEVKWLSQLRDSGISSDRERVEEKAGIKLEQGIFCTFVLDHNKVRAVNIAFGDDDAATRNFAEHQRLEFAAAASVAVPVTATTPEAATCASEPATFIEEQIHLAYAVDEKSGQFIMF